MVSVDTSEPALPLVRWSTGFNLLVGRVLAGDSFLQFIEPQGQSHKKIVRWLQTTMNLVRANDPAEAERWNDHPVRLRPQGENKAHSISATCKIVFRWDEEGGDGGSSSESDNCEYIVCLSLSEFKHVDARRRRHRQRRGSAARSESSCSSGSCGGGGSDDDGSAGRGTPRNAGAEHSGRILQPRTPGAALSL